MLRPRALAEPGRAGLYHVCSRVVDRRVIFGGRERRKFMEQIRGGAEFAGVELVSWCLMGNHFHLLVRVPPVDADALSDEEVLVRMESIDPEPKMRHFRGVWERMEGGEARRVFLARFRARMGDLSDFVKTLKQRFTQWFNRRTQREGTLWEGRFFSVMLSHNEKADGKGLGVLARFVAGYIDLNPVRAKVARDAAESDWSSYGAAVRGDGDARFGLRILWGSEACDGLDDKEVASLHGKMLERACKVGCELASGKAGASARAGVDPVSIGESGVGATLPVVDDEFRELRMLFLMARRCEALTKRRVLGAGWVVAESGG